MSNNAIEIENLSKLYSLGTIGTGYLSKDLNRWWAKTRGKEDPYMKIGSINDRTKKDDSGFVWALKDINLNIEKGDVVGIIGKNGAGKSTLLKILSKITTPTTGQIRMQGRVASLLQVGISFHPEMTGRENIFINGAILGMTRKEIKARFDEIVDFAGIEKYIDTPIKRYSSGMNVRLGFAVAAHLEPEILIVDEVLAVGDAEFQKKAIGKIQDVAQGEGRTVLFVSHNMDSVKRLCRNGIIIDNGQVHFTGDINSAVDHYLSLYDSSEGETIVQKAESVRTYVNMSSIHIDGSEATAIRKQTDDKVITLRIEGEANDDVMLNIRFLITTLSDTPLASYSTFDERNAKINLSRGHFIIERTLQLPDNMRPGDVLISLFIYNYRDLVIRAYQCCRMTIYAGNDENKIEALNSGGIVEMREV